MKVNTTSANAFAAALAERLPEIERELAATLDRLAAQAASPRLQEAMAYGLLGPGKRIRPLLVLLACEAYGGTRAEAWPAAVAVECIHAYSLIHDDLPCMDDDTLRRGRPTLHVVYDEATAVLVGDALQALAFAELTRLPAEQAAAATACLAAAVGAGGMVGGQMLDMAGEGQAWPLEAVLALHRAKTGALLAASLELGALAAGQPPAVASAWRAFAAGVGILFQATDDLLDATATTTALGKTAGKDAAVAKATLAAALGIDGLKRFIASEQLATERAWHELALAAHPAAAALAALPAFLASRET